MIVLTCHSLIVMQDTLVLILFFLRERGQEELRQKSVYVKVDHF